MPVDGWPGVAGLVEEGRRAGLPGMVPSGRWSLAAVPELVLGELAAARRGVVVLGVDGLSHAVAARCWASAELRALTSTFPSTSATGWLTALTGVGPREHGVPGMVYRVGGSMVYAVTGEGIAGTRPVPASAVLARPTVFERAAGARCLALGRELDHLPGPWVPALLRGTSRAAAPRPPEELAAQAADPERLVDIVAADVTAVLRATAPRRGAPGGGRDAAEPRAAAHEGRAAVAAEGRVLLWVYVNVDDYVHGHGYDERVVAAMRGLDAVAAGWAGEGWTVVAHSDHGQVQVRPDPGLAAAWAEVDDPRECELPGGGAGRTRWLYPRAGREDAVRARLADALGDAAVVVGPGELGLPPEHELPADRVGRVIAIARSGAFPIPDPALRYEHGALDADEMLIPFAVWRPR